MTTNHETPNDKPADSTLADINATEIKAAELPSEPALEDEAADWRPDEAKAELNADLKAGLSADVANDSENAAPADIESAALDAAVANLKKSKSRSKKANNKSSGEPSTSGPVALIEDPYGIRSAEIALAQELGDDADLKIDEDLVDAETTDADDADLAAPDAESHASAAGASDEEEEIDMESVDFESADAIDLESLKAAMITESERLEKELIAIAGESPEDAAARNAEQIAEDEALAAQEKLDADAAAESDIDPELQAALPKDALDAVEMSSCIETLLFMSDAPMKLEKLQDLLGPEMAFSAFQEGMQLLRKKYEDAAHGIEIVEVNKGFQFRTKPGRAPLARKLAKIQTQRLSSGAMETLAICAYRQPVVKDDIDKIRGVDSSHFVRGLLEKNLIRISGRSDLPGRPMVYETTPQFLELFGLKDLSAMPSLRELEQMVPTSQTENKDEDPRVREMRKLVAEMKSSSESILTYDPREDEKILKEMKEHVASISTTVPSIEAEKEAARIAAGGAPRVVATPIGKETAEQPSLAVESASEAALDAAFNGDDEEGISTDAEPDQMNDLASNDAVTASDDLAPAGEEADLEASIETEGDDHSGESTPETSA